VITSSRLPVALLAGSLALGCAGLTPPLTPPERGGAPWIELTSKHFVLDTDVDAAEAGSTLAEFEGIYGGIEDVAFPSETESRSPIRIVLFGREKDYRLFGAKDTRGYFTPQLPNDLDGVPTMVLWGGLVASTRETFQHELTHVFVRRSLGWAPRWLNEGLAEYYETFELRDGAAVLGLPLPSVGIVTGGGWRSKRVGVWERALVPITSLPSVKELLRADHDEFNASDVKERPQLDDRRKQTGYYLAAWGFVHMLYSVPEYKALFNAVVDDVAHGKKLEAAWATRFAGVDPDRLEGDFREHLIRTESIEAQAWTTPYTPRPRAAPEQQRALSSAEVHVLWARLRPWDEQHLPAARTDVNAARAADPTSPEIQYWSGLFLRAEGDRDGAEAELSRALAQRPNDARYLLALGTYYRGLERNAPKDRLDDVMHRLAKVAVAPRALDFVASYDAATGEIDEGLRFAARATKADPACYRCFSTGARLLAAKGRLDEAVDAALRAVNLVPDGVRAPQLTRDLARYRGERDRARMKAE
jgi:tetratricopeptide (TPR) repeat protein